MQPILDHLPAWTLVFFRLTGLFIFAPLLGTYTIPLRVKLFLALVLSFAVYPVLLTPGTNAAALISPFVGGELSLWALPGLVGLELLIGAVIGYVASLPIMGLQLGGHVMDQQMGLGLAAVLAGGGDETGMVSRFYFLMATAIFVVLGGHVVLVGILAQSFHHVSLGGFVFDVSVVQMIVGLLSSAFDLAVRIAAPFLCLVFLETVAMGFIARTVPQMNILSIGFPLRILLGVGIIVVLLASHSELFMIEMYDDLEQLLRMLSR